MQCCTQKISKFGGFWYFLAILDCQIKKEVDMFDLSKANDFKRMLILKVFGKYVKIARKINCSMGEIFARNQAHQHLNYFLKRRKNYYNDY